jgi:hypothetical protein
MEHDHIGHHHWPTWSNTNNRPHTPKSSDFDDKPRKGNMLGLCWPSPPRSPVAWHRCRRNTLYPSSDSTTTWQCTRGPIGHVGDRLPKPQPRPKHCSTHHRCQTAHGVLKRGVSATTQASRHPLVLNPLSTSRRCPQGEERRIND